MEYSNPIISKFNADGSIERRNNETYQVNPMNLTIQLVQIPSEYHRVRIDGLIEVYDVEDIKENNFKVNYGTSIVQFHPSKASQYITVNEYYGTGVELITAKRVATEVTPDGDIVKTLQDDVEVVRSKVVEYDTIYESYTTDTTNRLETEMTGHRTTVNQLKTDYDNATHFTLVTSETGYYTAIADNTVSFQLPVGMFNPLIDILFLDYQGVVLRKDENYSITGGEVTLLGWTLKKDEKIYIKVEKGIKTIIPVGSDGGLIMNNSITEPKLAEDVANKLNRKLITNEYKFTATQDNTISFMIDGTYYNPLQDDIELYYNGSRLYKNINYTQNGLEVTIFPISTGEVITYRIIKSVTPQTPLQSDGTQLQNETVGLVKLTTDVQEKVNKVSVLENQLSDIAYSMSALKGDGITDDSATFQAIFDSAINNKVKKIIFPKANYKIYQPLFAKSDDIEIDLSGSTIISNANAISGVQAELGIINFRGEFTNGDVLNYIRTIRTNPSPPSDAPTITSYEAIYYKKIPMTTMFPSGRIKTSNNTYFTIGDEILIRAWTSTTGTNYNKDTYQPELTVVAKVIDKDDTYVYIDYYSPIEYPLFVQSASVKSVAIKCNMLKNVKIKNFKVIDEAPIESVNGIPTDNDRNKALCPISSILVNGIEIENVEVENHRGNGFFPWYSRNISVKNLKAKNARLWDGGLGYATQFIGCRDIKVDGIFGDSCRHVIDLSWSSYAHVKNAKGVNSKEADLDLHGICEHDITFENCEGFLVIGNGIIYFPNIAKNINIINCNIEMMNHIGIATYDDRFIDNVQIIGGKLKIKHLPMFLNLLIDNVKIDWEINSFVTGGINKRGKIIKTKMQIQNSDIKFTTNGSIDNLYLTNVDDTIFKNVNFDFDTSAVVPTTGLPIRNLSGLNLIIDNCNIKKLNVRFNSTIAQSILKVSKNNVEYTSAENKFIFIDQLTSCLLDLVVSDNIVKHKGTTAQFMSLQASNTNATNSKITGHFKDNTLIGNANAKIHYIHGGQGDITKLDARIYDYNNVVEFKDTSGSNILSTTRNFIIS